MCTIGEDTLPCYSDRQYPDGSVSKFVPFSSDCAIRFTVSGVDYCGFQISYVGGTTLTGVLVQVRAAQCAHERQ